MIFEKKVDFKPTSLKRHRHCRNGHSYDPSSKDKKEFISKIDNLPTILMSKAINTTLHFFEQRPKSHYRSGKYNHILKEKSPKYNTSKRDIDNMCKFVLDALNKKLYIDDSQIISMNCKKSYTENRKSGYIYMKFEEIVENIEENKVENIKVENIEVNLVIIDSSITCN